ncbi:MAG: sigma-70 family RNA polymerase sigma factor [Gemmatales bacterium]
MELTPVFLDRCRPLLRLMAQKMQLDDKLRRRFDSSDIVQETLMRAVAKGDQFRGDTEAEAVGWLKRVLHTVAHNKREEAEAQRRNYQRELPDVDWDDSLSAMPELAISTLHPDDRVARTELLIKLAQRIYQLPEDQCDVVNLRSIQGCSVPEIARLLGKSEKAVAGLLYRGYRALRVYALELGLEPE